MFWSWNGATCTKRFPVYADFRLKYPCRYIPDDPAIHNLDVPLELAAAAGAGPPHHRVGDAGGDAALEEDALPRAHPLRRLGIDFNARGLTTLHLRVSKGNMYCT